MLICHPYIFLEMFVQIFAHLKKIELSLLIIEFSKLFIYLRHKSFIRYVFCKYFLPVCGLFLHSSHSVFSRTEVLNFDEIQFIKIFFYWLCFSVISMKYLSNQRSQRFSPMFSTSSFIVLDFAFRSMIYYDLILYMVWGIDWSSLSSLIHWNNRPFSIELSCLWIFFKNKLSLSLYIYIYDSVYIYICVCVCVYVYSLYIVL